MLSVQDFKRNRVRVSIKVTKTGEYVLCLCVCMYTAAGRSVIHIGTDSSRTYIRHTIQIHISIPFTSDLCDVTVAQVLATMRTQKSASSSDSTIQKSN